MVTKLHKSDSTQSPEGPGAKLTGSVKESAQQIWQAGLGAFAKAQAEGARAFESLVKEGAGLQRKTQAAAEERISEATSKVSEMASDISSKASGHWDKLENIFEERVAKALKKLGVPSAKDVADLKTRTDELSSRLQTMFSASRATKASTRTPTRKASDVAAKPAGNAPTKAAAKRKGAPKSR